MTRLRPLTVILVLACVVIQYPLWVGKGSWSNVRLLETDLAKRVDDNDRLVRENEELAAEIRDLRNHGSQAVEERARYELGYRMQGERFVQYTRPGVP